MRLIVMILLAVGITFSVRIVALTTWIALGFEGRPEQFEDWALALFFGVLMAFVICFVVLGLWSLAGALI